MPKPNAKSEPKCEPQDPRSLRQAAEAGKTRAQCIAQIAAAGVLENAATVQAFSKGTLGEIDITEAVFALHDRAKAIQEGNLGGAEALLMAQASSLNAIFAEMARRAAANMGQHLGATESYLRLALKAQAQCRSTLETLATIKAGPVVIARQANIAHGPQQVNNGPNRDLRTRARTGAGNPDPVQNKLLGVSNGERLDTRTAGTAGRGDQALETVGAVNRSSK